MLSIIFAIVFGLAIGYFAIQNTLPVTIQFGAYVVENLPLYVVVIGSLILGLLIGWLFYAARTVSEWTVRGETRGSRWSRRTVVERDERLRDLEAENARLRTELASSRNYAPARAQREPLRPNEPVPRSTAENLPPL